MIPIHYIAHFYTCTVSYSYTTLCSRLSQETPSRPRSTSESSKFSWSWRANVWVCVYVCLFVEPVWWSKGYVQSSIIIGYFVCLHTCVAECAWKCMVQMPLGKHPVLRFWPSLVCFLCLAFSDIYTRRCCVPYCRSDVDRASLLPFVRCA